MKDTTLGILIIVGILVIGIASSGKIFGNKPNDKNNDDKEVTVKKGSIFFSGNSSKSSSGSKTVKPEPVTTQSIEKQLKEIRKQIAIERASPYEGAVTMSVKNPNELDEYVVLTARGSEFTPINITSWKLKSVVTGKSVTVGTASALLGFSPANSSVVLRSGDRALVYSDERPHYSFRTNKCTGYLEQDRDYFPTLERKCPSAETMVHFDDPIYEQDKCMDYLESVPRCIEPDEDDIPDNVTNACEDFIEDNLNYDSCVTMFRYNSDFYGKEWRMYPTSGKVNWREDNETIELLDLNGKVVDSVSY